MQILLLYLVTAVLFLGLDALMLRNVMQPLFHAHLGDALAERFRIVPAALFYMAYVGGVLWFASVPALRAQAPGQALLNGAILGTLAYGTYEFTNFATLRDWHWQMVAADLAWGTALTGLSAWAGVLIVRAMG